MVLLPLTVWIVVTMAWVPLESGDCVTIDVVASLGELEGVSDDASIDGVDDAAGALEVGASEVVGSGEVDVGTADEVWALGEAEVSRGEDEVGILEEVSARLVGDGEAEEVTPVPSGGFCRLLFCRASSISIAATIETVVRTSRTKIENLVDKCMTAADASGDYGEIRKLVNGSGRKG